MATDNQIAEIDRNLQCCDLAVLQGCELEDIDTFGLDLDTPFGQWQASYNITFNRVKKLGCGAKDALDCIVNRAFREDGVEVITSTLPPIDNGVVVGFSSSWRPYGVH